MGPEGHVHPVPRPRWWEQEQPLLVRSNRPGQTRREAGTQSQGSSLEDRPAADHRTPPNETRKGVNVKANLARFTGALALLASLALTIGAGVRWS
jgi:hypothetical protein